MGILEQLLSEIEDKELDQKVKKLCDQITDEERGKEEYTGPEGPNIFLSLEARTTDKEEFFLTLEREEAEKYIVCFYARFVASPTGPRKPLKRINSWEVKDDRANKIVRMFAEKLKYVRGE